MNVECVFFRHTSHHPCTRVLVYNDIIDTLPSLQLIPTELQDKWQKDLEAIDSKLGGTPDKPISSLLIMLETPGEMVVVCTAGEFVTLYY